MGLLRKYTPSAMLRHRFAYHVASVLAKLLLCRTPVLGDRLYQCTSCGQQSRIYNSCTDRHCPLCSGARRRDWLDNVSELILPGVNYFQLVFTLPGSLSPLILGNRRPLYNLLFHSAWRSLQEEVRTEQGYQPAAVMVLHT